MQSKSVGYLNVYEIQNLNEWIDQGFNCFTHSLTSVHVLAHTNTHLKAHILKVLGTDSLTHTFFKARNTHTFVNPFIMFRQPSQLVGCRAIERYFLLLLSLVASKLKYTKWTFVSANHLLVHQKSRTLCICSFYEVIAPYQSEYLLSTFTSILMPG